MKSVYILLAALLVCFTPCAAYEAERPDPQNNTQSVDPDNSPFRFEVVEWDFGDIHEEEGNVEHIFRFTNTGKTPLAIDRVVASCGCTTPEYPRSVIAAGESAEIKVSFDPRGFANEFAKSVTVISGGGKYRNFLEITGRVIPRPKTVEEEYPYDVGGGLRIDNTLLTFRTVAQGRSAAMTVNYVNTSDKPASLAVAPVEESGFLDIYAPEVICAGCKGTMTLTYDLSERERYGSTHDVLNLSVDGKLSRTTIYTAMTGIDDFSGVDTGTAPRFFLEAVFHNFGEIRRRTIPYVFRLTASNEGAETLHIRSVSENAGFRSTLREGMTIAPGASLPFELLFYSNEYSDGEVMESIIIVADDPMRPTREIRMAAIIK